MRRRGASSVCQESATSARGALSAPQLVDRFGRPIRAGLEQPVDDVEQLPALRRVGGDRVAAEHDLCQVASVSGSARPYVAKRVALFGDHSVCQLQDQVVLRPRRMLEREQ